nr:hypothetical protein BaRGS_014453 [Batillaria attramentaria]
MLQTGGSHGANTPEEPVESILEEDELFMALTQEERDAWRQMMEQRETTLKNSKEQFTKWYDGFTRRRMFAYSRMRKLQESFRQRGQFYAEVSDIMAAMEAKVKAKSSKVKFAPTESAVNGEESSTLRR